VRGRRLDRCSGRRLVGARSARQIRGTAERCRESLKKDASGRKCDRRLSLDRYLGQSTSQQGALCAPSGAAAAHSAPFYIGIVGRESDEDLSMPLTAAPRRAATVSQSPVPRATSNTACPCVTPIRCTSRVRWAECCA
jgi:hypothetical protein